MIIGIVGKSGAGKTTVLNEFAAAGAATVDCDVLSREAARQKEVAAALFARFPQAFENGALNRRALASIVFGDPEKLEELNRITHPAIVELIEREIANAERRGYKAVAVDGATLIEAGFAKKCDRIVAVIASEQFRMKRIMARDGLGRDEAQRRIAAQKPDGFYTGAADYVIVNDSGPEELRRRAKKIAEEIIG